MFIQNFAVTAISLYGLILFNQITINFATEENLQYRLSNSTQPKHYDISISTKIDEDDYIFRGVVKILIIGIEETKSVTLHTKMCEIEKMTLKTSTYREINIKDSATDDDTEILTLNLDESLNINEEYILEIEYNSTLREDKLGFYRSSYKADDDSKVWLAATKFAPTEARHAFPCYDEPKFKATFSVMITHPNNLEALSNTNSDKVQDNSDGSKTTFFKKTPIMSTYLVGFVISDFKKKTFTHTGKINHEIYARPNAIKYATFVGQYGATVYGKLLEYLGGAETQPDEIETMKQVLLPDFDSSGMENWGIVTYRESKILYNKNLHDSKYLVNIFFLMSHEISHQWFGNLVTHEWWTYVWLKEGFSTLYGYYGAAMVYPQWNLMEQYQSSVQHFVFTIDDQKDIRPMSFYVEKQKDIRENYDRIAYEKSSCVLRMFDNALGKNIFKDGVDLFLKNGKFKSSTENDLFEALDESNNKNGDPNLNIKESFGTWSHQGGYPILSVSVHNDGTIRLHQERFLSNGNTDKSLWHIPINYEISGQNNFSNTTAKFWMKNREEEFAIETNFDITKDWIIFNIQQTGYYRVNYNPEMWNQNIKILKMNHTLIHVANRAQLIDDAFNMAKANKLDYKILLSLLEYLQNEREYAPWAAFNRGLGYLNEKFVQSNLNKSFQLYMQKTIEPAFKDFGLIKITKEAPLVSITRNIVANYACEYGLTGCTESKLNFSIPDMRTVYYCNKLKSNDLEMFLKVKELIKSSEDASERADLIYSLGCYESEPVLNMLLHYTAQGRNDLGLTMSEKMQLLNSIYGNTQLGLRLSLKFIANNWKYLNTFLEPNDWENVPINLSKYVHEPDLVEMFNELLGRIRVTLQAAEISRQNLINNIEWDLLNKEEVRQWFANSSYYVSSAYSVFFNFKLLLISFSVLGLVF